MRTAALTSLAMAAFAANSVLCRMALETGSIDAGSFTAIRLGSGAIVLVLIVRARQRAGFNWKHGRWPSAAALFVYAAAFSFAYRYVNTGTGALIMFGAVQLTMLLSAMGAGERPPVGEWVGIVAATAGFIYLVLPGLEAPSPAGAALMACAGIAWGVYSLLGRGSTDAVGDTAGNFVRAVPFAFVAGVVAIGAMDLSLRGVLLATLSGAVTSGLGYVLWYAALQKLAASQAALVQLSVPVLAALGGVLFLTEAVSMRLVVSALLVLGGIAVATVARNTSMQRSRSP